MTAVEQGIIDVASYVSDWYYQAQDIIVQTPDNSW